MEVEVRADRPGTIAELYCKSGQAVIARQLLLAIRS